MDAVSTMVLPRSTSPVRAAPVAVEATTRELILDAAERMFADRGLDGVAVRDLARELGMTPSSLYNHFPGKQALYDAVITRGLGPIVELVARAWQPGGLSRDGIARTLDELLGHLARHAHLARLLQRALLEESRMVRRMMAPFEGTLYREGVGVVGKAADRAGWTPDEVPHLAMGLFGIIYGYFTNAATLSRVAGLGRDPLSPQALRVQRRFLEKAVLRLLGPAPAQRERRRGRP